jgi:hypothetical protein
MGKTIITYLRDGAPKRNQYLLKLLLNSHELVGNYNTLNG